MIFWSQIIPHRRLSAHPYFLIKIWVWWARNFRNLIESDDSQGQKTRLAVFCGQKTLLRLTKAKKTGARPNGFIRAGSPVFLGSRFWSQIIPRRRSEFSRILQILYTFRILITKRSRSCESSRCSLSHPARCFLWSENIAPPHKSEKEQSSLLFLDSRFCGIIQLCSNAF